MALSPQAMMMMRRGPTQGPTPNPGGVPPGAPGAGPPGAGMPGTPGTESPGNLLMTAIAQRVNEQKKANSGFAHANINQMKRVVAATMIHMMQSHPEVARDLNRAWAALDQAHKKLGDTIKEDAMPPSPPLGFSGAAIGPSQANPQMGNGGGGMGVPS